MRVVLPETLQASTESLPAAGRPGRSASDSAEWEKANSSDEAGPRPAGCAQAEEAKAAARKATNEPRRTRKETKERKAGEAIGDELPLYSAHCIWRLLRQFFSMVITFDPLPPATPFSAGGVS